MIDFKSNYLNVPGIKAGELLLYSSGKKKPYKNAFVVGRFQPLHKGHIEMIRGALEVAETVLVIIGSAWETPSLKNPFSFSMREHMIDVEFAKEVDEGRLLIDGISDYTYRDSDWYSKLNNVVNDFFGGEDVVFYTCAKDTETETYIRSSKFEKIYHEQTLKIDATNIRKSFFEGCPLDFLDDDVSPNVMEMLGTYKELNDNYHTFSKELSAIKEYNKSWEKAPFPPHFVAVDALVRWNDHILVIKRKSDFGHGKIALPGGYLEVKETLLESAKRELREETGLTVDDAYILDNVHVFDAPNRSQRGRMITHVHEWRLCSPNEPVLTAGDDAAEAFWMPIDEIYDNKTKFFGDHYWIITKLFPEYEKG